MNPFFNDQIISPVPSPTIDTTMSFPLDNNEEENQTVDNLFTSTHESNENITNGKYSIMAYYGELYPVDNKNSFMGNSSSGSGDVVSIGHNDDELSEIEPQRISSYQCSSFGNEVEQNYDCLPRDRDGSDENTIHSSVRYPVNNIPKTSHSSSSLDFVQHPSLQFLPQYLDPSDWIESMDKCNQLREICPSPRDLTSNTGVYDDDDDEVQGETLHHSTQATILNDSTANHQWDYQYRAIDYVTMEEIRPLFHYNLHDAAKKLCVCTTLLKKICRKLNISRWPFRQIHRLENKLRNLVLASYGHSGNLTDTLRKSLNDQIDSIKAKIEEIKDNAVGGKTSQGPSTDRADCDEALSTSTKTKESVGHTSENTTAENKNVENKKRKFSVPAFDNLETRTLWVANCSACGKVGKYRHPSEGRLFQHSTGSGKYCGYYRDNPRPVIERNVRSILKSDSNPPHEE